MSAAASRASRVAIVTGGATGLGLAMTLALLAAGHRVVAVGRAAEPMEALERATAADGSRERLLTVRADVTAEADCQRAFDAAIGQFGGIDALVNNAGANVSAHVSARFYDVPVAVWKSVVDTNLTGAFLMARIVTPHLVDRGWGRVVNQVTSYGTMSRGGYTPYGPSKAALETATGAWAHELEGTGVTVNAILPGGASDTRRISREDVPDRSRLISPTVMGAPVVWLMSAEADAVTGRRIVASAWDPRAATAANLKQAAVAAASWRG